jgi:hypothetical protein
MNPNKAALDALDRLILIAIASCGMRNRPAREFFDLLSGPERENIRELRSDDTLCLRPDWIYGFRPPRIED